ncbi:MAG: hypothetical protein RL653_548 [Pseudomonadota bacterium]
MTDGPRPGGWRRLPPMPLRLPRSRASARGQNLVEYSVINVVMTTGLLLATTVKLIPGPQERFAGAKMNILEALLWSMQIYLDGFAYVLNQPFP